MSLHIVVFVRRARSLPNCEQISTAAREAGFALEFSVAIDERNHAGAIPVTCQGTTASFEYFCNPIASYLAEVGDELGFFRKLYLRRFAFAVDFISHSRRDDRNAAVVAAASCARSCGGLLLDCQSGEFVSSSSAFSWARESTFFPDRSELERRECAATAVSGYFDQLLPQLGYRRLESPPDPDADEGTFWYARIGKTLASELIEATVNADHQESFLTVTFFGSTSPISQVRLGGPSGNLTGHYLDIVGHYLLRRDLRATLPRNIPIAGDFVTSAIAQQLEAEIRAADSVVFSRVRAALEEAAEDERH